MPKSIAIGILSTTTMKKIVQVIQMTTLEVAVTIVTSECCGFAPRLQGGSAAKLKWNITEAGNPLKFSHSYKHFTRGKARNALRAELFNVE